MGSMCEVITATRSEKRENVAELAANFVCVSVKK